MTTYEDIRQMAEQGEASPEAAQTWWARCHEGVLVPNALEIAKIVRAGDIAVVVWEPHELILEGVRAIGYDGTTPVFRLSSGKRKALVASFREANDRVSEKWFARKATNRIYLLTGLGSLLINIGPNGMAIEPGSLDENTDRKPLEGLLNEWAQKS
jgi:hypothetical protein